MVSDESRKNNNTPNQRIRSGLMEHIVEFDTTDPRNDSGDLRGLQGTLEGRRIIALGEATHGTAEFFRLKHRILRFLVEELDLQLIGLEANFTEMLAVDKYVRNDGGNPMPFRRQWVWKTEEMLSFIEWVKEYNTTRLPNDEVRLFGFDIQIARRSASFLLDYLEQVDPDYLRTVRDDLDLLAERGLQLAKASVGEAELAPSQRIVSGLRAAMEERRAQHINRSSKRTWQLACQHLTIIEQATEFGEEVQGCEGLFNEEALRLRDRAMAENVEWVLDYEQADRIAIWAHNDHVNRIKTTAGGFDVSSMGNHLSRMYGNEYYAIAFEFGYGSFLAMRESESGGGGYDKQKCTLDNSIPNTLASTLNTLDRSPAYIDVHRAKNDPDIGDWLTQKHKFHQIGAVYEPDKPEENVETYMLTESFDGLCFVEETTETNLL